MNIQIYGTQYTKKNMFGDFNMMCEQKEYEDSLFIFNDNEEYHNTNGYGIGNAIIRKYNKHNKTLSKPKSAGICTGTLKYKGYKELSEYNKNIIDNNINEIKKLIEKYEYKNIYYSVGKNNKIGTSLFKVGEDVIDYIDEQICKLSILDVIILK